MMALWARALMGVFCCAVLHTAEGYSSGASTDTCADMRPQHGVPGKATPTPYTLTAAKYTYKAHEEIQVTISGSEVFTGFLLEAVSTDRDTHVGFFQTGNSPDAKTLGCGQGDAATNSRKLFLRTITVTWRGPAQTVGNVHMMATVIKDQFTFWVKIRSPVLTEVLPPLPPNFAEGGGSTPGSGTQPGLCQPEDTAIRLAPITSESFTIRWTYMPCTSPPEVEFDVTADTSDSPFSSAWIAIAFSKDEFMGDDSVIECLQVQNNQIAFRASYNQPGVKGNILIHGTNIGLTPLAATAGNGKFNCRFRRAVSVQGDVRIFDLTAQKYRLLAARGATNGNGVKIAHSTQYKKSPVVSAEFIDFTESGYLKTMK